VARADSNRILSSLLGIKTQPPKELSELKKSMKDWLETKVCIVVGVKRLVHGLVFSTITMPHLCTGEHEEADTDQEGDSGGAHTPWFRGGQ
jgi:hypothetical protein